MTDRESIIRKFLLDSLSMQKPSQAQIDQILLACRVSSEEDAPNNPENIYIICHTVAKQYNLYPAMRTLMKQKWGVESMKEMSLPALKDLFYYMRSMEHIKKSF